jgi:hypothetical protein
VGALYLVFYLDIETMCVPLFIAIDELEKVSHRREHAFANMVSINLCQMLLSKHNNSRGKQTNLGNFSASRRTTSIPSRARAADA